MKTPSPIKVLPFICWLSSINIGIAQPLDKSAIHAIDLHIDPPALANPPVLAKLSLSDTQSIRAGVMANLSQWRFPLQAENGNPYTHTLSVEIGNSKYGQTPVGFSFTSGNADPRAPGFQKAQVIPIQCRLTDNANPKQEEHLEMTFSAPSSSSTSQQLQAELTDNISSVCFDLLDSLKFLPPPTPAETAVSVTKPTWMPSVQVETVPVPQPQPQPTAETLPAATSPAVPATSAAVAAKNPAKPITTTPTVTPPATEPQETRKQLIIHNQGTPVIIKFGYDRR
jgi:hypothetical protein